MAKLKNYLYIFLGIALFVALVLLLNPEKNYLSSFGLLVEKKAHSNQKESLHNLDLQKMRPDFRSTP